MLKNVTILYDKNIELTKEEEEALKSFENLRVLKPSNNGEMHSKFEILADFDELANVNTLDEVRQIKEQMLPLIGDVEYYIVRDILSAKTLKLYNFIKEYGEHYVGNQLIDLLDKVEWVKK
jgi:hypothetical protein